MGLFDGILKSNYRLNENLDVQHAVVVIVLASIMSDEWESPEELLLLRQIMAKSPIFGESNDSHDALLVRQCRTFIESRPDALDIACSGLEPRLRETAFAMACEIIFADRIVDPKEAQFIENLAAKLEVPDDLARSVVRTCEVMYRAPASEKPPLAG